jgi:oligopeptide transport system ATP-binding protein
VKAVNGINYSQGNTKSWHRRRIRLGKSVEAYAIMGLLQSGPRGRREGLFDGENILTYDSKKMTDLRGNKISMIFQNPMTCLNPVYTIGDQLVEALTCHDKSISKADAKARAVEMLELVGINNAEKRFTQYPHEFSGGMRQAR